MSWYIAIIIVILVSIILYESVYGFFFNQKFKPCSTCEDYNVHPLYSDKEKAAELMEKTDQKIEILFKHLRTHDYQNIDVHDGLKQLFENYDNNNIYEISPYNIMGKTSFLRNKRMLVLCLRRKGDGHLHDENTIFFVVLHELAHMMNKDMGHDEKFWRYFKFLLIEAVHCDTYTPIDYSQKNVLYCGLNIEFNPLYSDQIEAFQG